MPLQRGLSIRNKLSTLILTFAGVVLSLMALSYFVMDTLSTVRAINAAEGFFSKAQKDAVTALFKYGVTRDERDYQRFKDFIRVPQADARARVELARAQPDLELIQRSLIVARNDPEDVEQMALLMLRFRDTEFISRLTSLWSSADVLVTRLDASAEALHASIIQGRATSASVAESLKEIDEIDEKLRALEDGFSSTLGELSRWLRGLLTFVTAVTTALLLGLAALIASYFSRGITRDIEALREGAERIAEGDFSHPIQLSSKDELGDLADAFNHMTDRLRIALAESTRAEEVSMLKTQVLNYAQALARLGVWEWHAATDTVTLSDELRRLYELEAEAGERVPTSLIWSKIHPDDRERARNAVVEAGAKGQTFDFEARVVQASGTTRVIHQRGRALIGANGERTGLLAAVQDVTERKEMEARLLLADRMASLGTLAGGVAHEINNPLTYVTANLHFLAAMLPESTELPLDDHALAEFREVLGEAQQGADRVGRIVRDLKTFSRPESEELRPVDVSAVLESALKMCSNQIRHRANLVTEFGRLPPVLGNESRLGQVFINLLVNAAQAIHEGQAARNEIRVRTHLLDGARVAIDISDTGSGIPEELQKRIFDPFFTTKPVGVGTGLGLSICHGILKALGGEISVTSVVGKGSTFRVALPSATAEGRAVSAPQPNPTARAKLLVVDDEALVGASLQRLLSEHDVTVAASGKDALGRIRSGERFDVILCDLMMPEMTGMALHQAVGEVAPELVSRMVFVTGGAFTPESEGFLKELAQPLVEKPFDPVVLREVIRGYMSPSGKVRAQ